MSIHLVGGGRDVTRARRVFKPFLQEVGSGDRRIAVLLVLEEDDVESVPRYTVLVGGAAVVHVVLEGDAFSPDVLEGADAVVVGGGLTPAYADALAPIAGALRARVLEGMPYLGFSAGAACAATEAIVGGYLLHGVPVTSEDAGEELDEVTVRPGLGLVPFSVDVHAAQWGTVSRALAAVEAGKTARAAAVDEYTALIVAPDGTQRVVGEGRVWRMKPGPDGAVVSGLR